MKIDQNARDDAIVLAALPGTMFEIEGLFVWGGARCRPDLWAKDILGFRAQHFGDRSLATRRVRRSKKFTTDWLTGDTPPSALGQKLPLGSSLVSTDTRKWA